MTPIEKFEAGMCAMPGCLRVFCKQDHLMCEGHFKSLPRKYQQLFYRARFKYRRQAEAGATRLDLIIRQCVDIVTKADASDD